MKILFRKHNADDRFEYSVSILGGLMKYQVTTPVITTSDTNSQRPKRISFIDIWELISLYHSAVSRTKSFTKWRAQFATRLKWRECNWYTWIGAGDVIWTAMASGLVWWLKMHVIVMMYPSLPTNGHRASIDVVQIQQMPLFATEIHADISISELRCALEIFKFIGLLVCSPASIYHWLKFIKRLRRVMKNTS